MCVCVCACARVHACTCIYVCIRIRMYVCMHACTHVCVHISMSGAVQQETFLMYCVIIIFKLLTTDMAISIQGFCQLLYIYC